MSAEPMVLRGRIEDRDLDSPTGFRLEPEAEVTRCRLRGGMGPTGALVEATEWYRHAQRTGRGRFWSNILVVAAPPDTCAHGRGRTLRCRMCEREGLR